jgi:hypothetical protein
VGSTIRTVHPVATDHGVDLHVAVSGETNVHAELRRSVLVRVPGGEREIDAVSFLVDDPRTFVGQAKGRLLAVG